MPSHNHLTTYGIIDINHDSGKSKYSHANNTGSWWFQEPTQCIEYTGGNGSHNNLVPYVSIYIFKRIS